MAVILDTGVLYAYYDRSDEWHKRSAELIRSETGELIVPGPVIPEVDHLLGSRLGAGAQRAFYVGLAEGAYFVASLPSSGYRRVLEINDRYRDLRLGFVDAAILVIADELGLRRVATTDRRDFGAVQSPLKLELLPN